MSLSLTGCSELIGAMCFAYLSAMNNTYVEKEDVFEYVIENEFLLNQAIETGDYSTLVHNGTFEYDDISYTFDHEGIVEDVYISEDYVQFGCAGSGMGSATTYTGFSYVPDDDILKMWSAPPSVDMLVPSGNGYEYLEQNGDNRFYVENICGSFYYYEASY